MTIVLGFEGRCCVGAAEPFNVFCSSRVGLDPVGEVVFTAASSTTPIAATGMEKLRLHRVAGSERITRRFPQSDGGVAGKLGAYRGDVVRRRSTR